MRDFKKLIKNYKHDLDLFFIEFRNTFGEQAEKFEWFTSSELAYRAIMRERSLGLITRQELDTKLETLFQTLQTTLAAYQAHGEYAKGTMKDVFLSLVKETDEEPEPILDEVGLRAMRRNLHETCAKAKLTSDKELIVSSLSLFQDLDLYQSQSNTAGFDTDRKVLKTLRKSISELEKRIGKLQVKQFKAAKTEILALLKSTSALDLTKAFNHAEVLGMKNEDLRKEIGFGMTETAKAVVKESIKTFLNSKE